MAFCAAAASFRIFFFKIKKELKKGASCSNVQKQVSIYIFRSACAGRVPLLVFLIYSYF